MFYNREYLRKNQQIKNLRAGSRREICIEKLQCVNGEAATESYGVTQ